MARGRKGKSKRTANCSKILIENSSEFKQNVDNTNNDSSENSQANNNVNTSNTIDNSLQELRIIKNIFAQASESLSKDITSICSSSNHNTDNNVNSTAFDDIKINLRHNFKNLNLAFSCLEKKYLYTLYNSNISSNDLKVNSASGSPEIEKSTQTDPICNEINHTNIAVQTYSSVAHNNSSSLNNNNFETKFLKIKIEDVPSDFLTNDISLAIQNIMNDDQSSISFIRICRHKNDSNCNYVFKVPLTTAMLLFASQQIKINSIYFTVKPFIDIIRCFICQRLGHCAKFCTNSATCALCGKTHAKGNCNKIPFCVNCAFNNKFKNQKFNVRHASYSKQCSSIKLYIDSKRQSLTSPNN